MGVADSPDLANLFGVYYETKCNILGDHRILYYGRYIDDLLMIVYAKSREEAMLITEKISFDTCQITWDASPQKQPFLDMLLYVDQFGKLAHMPYRKSGSHQERVPWISHHPIDVKKGTFIGELTRMAVLSSNYDNYSNAVTDLVGLYIKRGYPTDLIKNWTRNYAQARWNKRLVAPVDRTPEGVLVLKSDFNHVWEHFSATELGKIFTGYCNEWFAVQEVATRENRLIPAQNRFPEFPGFLGGLDDVSPGLKTRVNAKEGPVEMPDIRKTDILSRRWIVSRKRTKNLFDLTAVWKQTLATTQQRYAHKKIITTLTPSAHADVDLDDGFTTEESDRSTTPVIKTSRRSKDDFVNAWNDFGSGWATAKLAHLL